MNNRLVIGYLLISAAVFSSCGKSSINVIRLSQESPIRPVTEPVTIYQSKCVNEEVQFYGNSHSQSLRVFPEGNCPANENLRTESICIKDYSYSMVTEYFTNKDCVGSKTLLLTTLMTTPIEQKKLENGMIEIDYSSGPTFLRVKGDLLIDRYNETKFCGESWSLNENHEVTGKKCGENPYFLTDKVSLFSVWKKTGEKIPLTIQFGLYSLKKETRPTTLSSDLIFNLK